MGIYSWNLGKTKDHARPRRALAKVWTTSPRLTSAGGPKRHLPLRVRSSTGWTGGGLTYDRGLEAHIRTRAAPKRPGPLVLPFGFSDGSFVPFVPRRCVPNPVPISKPDFQRNASPRFFIHTRYDPEGNRIARFIDVNVNGILDSGDTDVTKYTWDARNRLVTVADYETYGGDPAQVVDYLYDLENRWIGKLLDSDGDGTVDQRTTFAYDGNQIVRQFETDGDSDLTPADLSHRYLWQPDAVDQIMADEQVASPDAEGDVVWPLGDHLGTVRDLAVTDPETGETSVVNHITYDSFGNRAGETNAAIDCLFGFTGRALDEATGLQNNLNRWYDSAVGRWLSNDPVRFEGKDANAYRYVGNDPIRSVDPHGLDRWLVWDGFHFWIIVDWWLKDEETGVITRISYRRLDFSVAGYCVTWGMLDSQYQDFDPRRGRNAGSIFPRILQHVESSHEEDAALYMVYYEWSTSLDNNTPLNYFFYGERNCLTVSLWNINYFGPRDPDALLTDGEARRMMTWWRETYGDEFGKSKSSQYHYCPSPKTTPQIRNHIPGWRLH